MPNDVAWREKLAKWQGGLNATIKDLAKNQDDLEEQINTVRACHYACREEVILKLTELEVAAKQAGKRWGLIYGIIASVVTAIITFIITHAILAI